ncbi:hypothetical protein MOMA_09256 [Moraxella macacae 0408225]|uniref:Uncharacterized protein n=1 Tax=Moraxella macacae 0408225 TaxID=1230338 RepID=L2F757_9GAMM|nr:phage tail tube protein [Moraxella macacae]ELA08735.1 hypothetical protein MOMA_09256 [Moraxella macacae 0408225]
MAKVVENLADSFFTLNVSTRDDDYQKVEHLQKCDHPSEEKTTDEVTATDDNRTIKAVVNFKEESEIEFEYVLDLEDSTHQLLQTSFESGTELFWQLKYVSAPSESRQFKGMIVKLTADNSDTKKKIRKTGTITITSDLTKI